MIQKILIFTLFYSPSIMALNHNLNLNLQVVGHGLNYSVQYKTSESVIRSKHISDKVKLTRCNQIFYAMIAGQILDEKPFQKKYESKNEIKNSQRYSHIQYKSSGKIYIVERESNLGQILLRIPSRFQIAKIAERQKCLK